MTGTRDTSVQFILADAMLANARSMEETGFFQPALDYLQQAETIYRAGGNIAFTSCMLSRANILLQMGRIAEAEGVYKAHGKVLLAHFDKPEANNESSDYVEDYINSAGQLGRILLQRSDITTAIEIFSEVRQKYAQLCELYPLHAGYYRAYIYSVEMLGDAFLSARQLEEALINYQQAYNLLTEMLRSGTPMVELHFDFARVNWKLGRWYRANNLFEEALQHLKQGVRYLGRHADLFAAVPEVSKEHANMLVDTAEVYALLDKRRAAQHCFTIANRIFSNLFIDFPLNSWYKELFTISLHKAGRFYVAGGLYQQAEKLYTDCIRMRRELMSDYPAVLQFRTGLAVAAQSMGDLLLARQDTAAAWEQYTLMQETVQQLLQDHAASPQLQHLAGMADARLAQIKIEQGDYEEAKKYLLQCLEVRRQLNASYPHDAQYSDDLAIVYQDLAEVYLQMGELRTSMYYQLRYHRLAHRLAEQYPQHSGYRQSVIESSRMLSGLYQVEGRPARASHFENLLRAVVLSGAEVLVLLASMYRSLYELFARQGDKERQLRAGLQFYQFCKEMPVEQAMETTKWNELALTAELLVTRCHQLKKTTEAAVMYTEANRMLEKLIDYFPDDDSYRKRLDGLSIYGQSPLSS